MGILTPAMWAMIIGMLGGSASLSGVGGDFVSKQVEYMGNLAGGGLIAIPIFLMIVIGKLPINTLNAYGTFMCTLTISTSFIKQRAASMHQRVWPILAMIKNVVMLLMVFLRWSVSNLIDYDKISRERIDNPALYALKGRYGVWNVPALTSLIGILVQIPFRAQSLHAGPFTKVLGGTDISWVVGLVANAAVYYFRASRSSVAQDAMIYPEGFLAEDEPRTTAKGVPAGTTSTD